MTRAEVESSEGMGLGKCMWVKTELLASAPPGQIVEYLAPRLQTYFESNILKKDR